MLTDWLIVRRLAAELDRKLRGARIRGAGRLSDGRFGLRLAAGMLALDAFGPTPIVALENDAELERTAGWVRTLADALERLRIDRVRARRGDRLIAFECSSRSRFGVESAYRLVAELVPRFGNIVLLKDDTVVGAAREFAGGGAPTAGGGPRRTTQAGEPYEPPPLPARPLGEGTLEAAFDRLRNGEEASARERAEKALRASVPLLPRLVAQSLIAESIGLLAAAPEVVAARCLARATTLVEATEGEASALGDIYAYRDGARLVACHVVPLAQYAELRLERAPLLLPLLAEAIGSATQARAAQVFDARRATYRTRLEKRLAVLAAQRTALERERDDAQARDTLRVAGEMLYAHLAEVLPGATFFVPPSDPSVTIALDPALDAKGNAAAIFKRYRKAVAKQTHVAKRLAESERETHFALELTWELERAEPETLGDVAESIERFERRKNAPRPSVKPSETKRRPISVPVAPDARVYIGRSPAGNADLTFRLARPHDLWFHVRGTPGAHVVLHIDSARAATSEEVLLAASLAAYHSKARSSDKVAVDYTERKHVRRQQNAPPGLVWYTGARTLLATPRPGAVPDPADPSS